MRNYLSIDAR